MSTALAHRVLHWIVRTTHTRSESIFFYLEIDKLAIFSRTFARRICCSFATWHKHIHLVNAVRCVFSGALFMRLYSLSCWWRLSIGAVAFSEHVRSAHTHTHTSNLSWPFIICRRLRSVHGPASPPPFRHISILGWSRCAIWQWANALCVIFRLFDYIIFNKVITTCVIQII